MKKKTKKKAGKAAAAPAQRTFNKHNIILLLTAAILLVERMPKGVVMRFSDGAEVITEYFSYFDSIPFGYGHFFPMVTAMLTVVIALLLGGFRITGRKGLQSAAEALSYTSLCTAFTALFTAIRFGDMTWINIAVPALQIVLVGLMSKYRKNNEDK